MLAATTSGCLFKTYDYYVRRAGTVYGYQSPPLMVTKDDVEIILNVKRVDLKYAYTYDQALAEIAKTTLVPLVITGNEDFLSKEADIEGLEGQSVREVLDALLGAVDKSYSIKQGWINIE
jgi:hypothetical protein